MNFTSLPFIALVAGTLLLFNMAPLKWRWLLLLLASYLFYGSFQTPHLLLVLLAVTATSYLAALRIDGSARPSMKLFWMWGGIIFNLSLLFWLKYLPFVAENANATLDFFGAALRFVTVEHLVALGVSYYVFQGISYIVDVYLEVIKPERHPGYFSLSLAFFPKLLQGPIERSGNLLPQLHLLPRSSVESLSCGINLFLWGAFKKVVIADRLAGFVDPVYGNVHAYQGLPLLIATYLFALQLYFDFSGYTDMARGVGRLFNLQLARNFNSPYLATSIADFWRRWHISFSSWILDYIFKPLQFQLREWSRWGVPVALMATFLISGIWHGASWCFVAWGGIHGVYLAAGVLFKKQRGDFCKALGIAKGPFLACWQRFVTFHLVCFSWIFFRAQSLEDAAHVAVSSLAGLPSSLSLQFLPPGKSVAELVFALSLASVSAIVADLDQRARKNDPTIGELAVMSRIPTWGSAVAYGAIFYLITVCGMSAKGFLYQQF